MPPKNPQGARWDVVADRRRHLEKLYRAGLIAEFTQIIGHSGQATNSWVVETLDGQRYGIPPQNVTGYVLGFQHGHQAAGTRKPRKNRNATTPFSELHTVYGVQPETIHTWIQRGQFPPELIQGAEKGPTGRNIYRNAAVATCEAYHWGHSTGRLTPDGEPSSQPRHLDNATEDAGSQAA